MKGLLLKDFYLTIKYCRAFLLIVVLFLGLSFMADGNMFLIFYPCLFTTMIPVTLLGYDERSKWELYSATLPYTKAQIVSAKYLIGLIANGIVLMITALAQAVRMNRDGSFTMDGYLATMGTLVCMSLVGAACNLPVMFRYGVEKGRIAYLIMIGIICGGSVAAATLFESSAGIGMNVGAGMILALAVCVALYACSWYLAIRFYQKRELK